MRIITRKILLLIQSLSVTAFLLFSASSLARETASLNVISSSDSGSNEVNSFIVIPENTNIPEGIKQNSIHKNLSLQAPFVIELKQVRTEV